MAFVPQGIIPIIKKFKVMLSFISDLISLFTPIILFVWFLYSRWQALAKSYFEQIDGIYAGFTTPLSRFKDIRIYGGIIMNIRDSDDKGYFKGNFDFAERKTEAEAGDPRNGLIREGIHSFLGKLNFEIYTDKTRHPLRPEENRIYKGTLYIVDRLDFLFNEYKMKDYLSADYDVIHYREMQTLVFTLKKIHRKDNPELPKSFTLYKTIGSTFDPYKNVKEIVFQDRTFSDR